MPSSGMHRAMYLAIFWRSSSCRLSQFSGSNGKTHRLCSSNRYVVLAPLGGGLLPLVCAGSSSFDDSVFDSENEFSFNMRIATIPFVTGGWGANMTSRLDTSILQPKNGIVNLIVERRMVSGKSVELLRNEAARTSRSVLDLPSHISLHSDCFGTAPVVN